jgi:hypothetical protein
MLLEGEYAVHLESSERFAHRTPAGLELLREFRFRQALARRKPALSHVLADAVCDAFGDTRLGGDVTGELSCGGCGWHGRWRQYVRQDGVIVVKNPGGVPDA